MNKQESFKNNRPTLYLVATPIGNLSELSKRAIETLQSVDIIASEDTRHTKQLCTHFKISGQLISYHAHNEDNSSDGIIDLLKQEKSVALVSDAGYPCLCDPGYVLVRKCIENEINVVPISGPNAALNALVASGLVPYPHVFLGFLPVKSNAKKDFLSKYLEIGITIVFYESVHRIESTLQFILQNFGDLKICLARELTKVNEEFIRGTISEVLQNLSMIKGEFVICIEGTTTRKEYSLEQLNEMISLQIEKGDSLKQATKVVSKLTNCSRKELYDMYIKK